MAIFQLIAHPSKDGSVVNKEVASHRLERRVNGCDGDYEAKMDNGQMNVPGGTPFSDAKATPMAPTISAASAAAAVTTVSTAASIRQDATTKSVSLPLLSPNVLVQQPATTQNG